MRGQKIELSELSRAFRGHGAAIASGLAAIVPVLTVSSVFDCLLLPVGSLEVLDAALGCTGLQRHGHSVDTHWRDNPGRG
jgi:hypothetical protein